MIALVVSLPALVFVAWLAWSAFGVERHEHERVTGGESHER